MEEPEDRFLEHINVEDPLSVAIKGHLYVESRLVELVEEWLPHPEFIDLAQLNFPMKVDLALSVELLRPDEKSVLILLNRLRNKLGHDLDYDITESDQRALYNALPPGMQDAIGPFEVLFAEMDITPLRYIVAVLERAFAVRRRHVKAHKAEAEELRLRLRKTVEGIRQRGY